LNNVLEVFNCCLLGCCRNLIAEELKDLFFFIFLSLVIALLFLYV